MLLLFALIVGSGTAWADVVSGTTYSTPSTSNLPDGWSGDGSGTSYVQLTSSSNYIQTSSFAQNGFTSIVVKARTYGGPSAEQAVITVSWYSDENETVLGTISPSSKTLTNYTISSPNNPTGNTTGYIKIQCKGASSSKGSGVSEVTINYTAASGGSTTYTVTYDGNGATSGDVPEDNNEYEEDDEVTVLGNTGSLAKTGYTFGGWNTQNDGQGTNYTAGNTFTISANTTLYAKWIQNPYTVTLGDDSSTLTEVSGGAGVTLPSRSAIGSYTFAGWSETNVTSETTTAPTIISAGSYNPTSNITLFPVYTKTEGGGGSQNNTASVSIATYASDNSWVSGNSSGPQYTEVELNSDITATTTGTGNNGKYYSSDYSWRFYTNGSGNVIISTTAGTLSSVTLTYSGGFTYGGNAITSGNAVNVSGTSAEFTCTSNAKITAIEVNYTTTGGGTTYYWSSPVAATVERPEITIAENPFYFNTTATITCETTGATIYYTTDGSDPTTSSNVYSAAIPLTATTTIKAFAVLGSDESTIASVTATKNLATPTVTVSGDLTLDLDGGTDVNAGTLTAAVTYNDAAVAGATVTWSSSDTDVATIDENTGAVTILTTGTVTFTATYAGNSDYAEATGTKTVTVVDSNAPGSTPGNPYTVAQANAATPASGTSANVYIHGIVSAFFNTDIMSDGSNYRYYISDDGTTTSQLLVYKGKNLSNVAFSNADDLLIGDEVVIYGSLTTFSNAPEIASGNYVVSLVRPASISAEDVEIDADATSGEIAYTVNNPDGSTMIASEKVDVNWISNVAVDAANSKVTFDVTENTSTTDSRTATITLTYGSATKDVTVTQKRSMAKYTITYSVNGVESDVEYAEDETISLAAPDASAIPAGYTFMGWMETTINGTQATAPTYATAGLPTIDKTYYAVFAFKSSTTVSSNKTLEITNSDFIDNLTGSYATVTITKTIENTDYEIEANACKQNSMCQMRDNSTLSYIYISELPGIIKNISTTQCTNANGSNYTGTIHIKTSKTRGNSDTDDIVKAELSNATSFSIDVTGEYESCYIFTSAGLRIQDLTVTYYGETTEDTYSDYRTSVELSTTIAVNAACTDGNGNYYATFYTNRAYVMHDDLEGYVVSVVNNSNTLTLNAEYEGGDVVPANTPLLIYALEGGNYTVNFTNETGTAPVNTNDLKGTLTADELTVGTNCYFYRLTMHNGTDLGFYWGAENGGAFAPGANKAYLVAPKDAEIKGFNLFDDETAIEKVAVETDNAQPTFNLMGQRVNASTRGIVIRNGKKYINK